jgi:enoyl-CoA hydratase/carnithine racemase
MKKAVMRPVPDLIGIETKGDVTWLRFLQHELAGIDLQRMQSLWRFLDQQSEHPSKVVILEAPAGLLSPRSFDALMAGATAPAARDRKDSDPRSQDLWQALEDLRREENTQIQMVERITNLDALVIAVVRGEIDLALLGPVLCCDYQIAADDTVFVNRILEGGLPSVGGMMWFLVNRHGSGVARKILWSGDDLPASRALELGLVSEVAPALELQSRAQAVARTFARKPRHRLRAIKALLKATDDDLQPYLEQERRETNRSLGALIGAKLARAEATASPEVALT